MSNDYTTTGYPGIARGVHYTNDVETVEVPVAVLARLHQLVRTVRGASVNPHLNPTFTGKGFLLSDLVEALEFALEGNAALVDELIGDRDESLQLRRDIAAVRRVLGVKS